MIIQQSAPRLHTMVMRLYLTQSVAARQKEDIHRAGRSIHQEKEHLRRESWPV